MLPNINILGVNLSSYSIMAGLGITFTIIYIAIYAYVDHHELKTRIFYMCFALLFGVIGASLLYQLTNIQENIKLLPYLFTDFMFFYRNCSGGIVYYGGLIGVFVGTFVYTQWLNLDTRDWLMKMLPVLPLFHAFGRVGCALVGCCYGIETTTGGIYNEAVGHYCLPVQLYEAAGNLILFGLMLSEQVFLHRRKKAMYFLPMGTYLTFYGIMRFILEFFRGDAIRGIYGGLSTSQWISIVLVPIGIYCLLCPTRKNIFNHVYNREK